MREEEEVEVQENHKNFIKFSIQLCALRFKIALKWILPWTTSSFKQADAKPSFPFSVAVFRKFPLDLLGQLFVFVSDYFKNSFPLSSSPATLLCNYLNAMSINWIESHSLCGSFKCLCCNWKWASCKSIFPPTVITLASHFRRDTETFV